MGRATNRHDDCFPPAGSRIDDAGITGRCIMEFAVGLAQLLLAFVFMVVGGLMFGLEPSADGLRLRAWAPSMPSLTLKLAGVAEFAAGVAVLAPLAFDLPALSAAVGASIMVLAAVITVVIQIQRRSPGRLLLSLTLAALATFVLQHYLGA